MQSPGLIGHKTPFYLYDLDLLERTIGAAASAASSRGYNIHYALKANHETGVVSQILDKGIGIDCVSGGELERALELGCPAGNIVFAGVGKTDDEIIRAIESGILCLNCESLEELEVIDKLASASKRQVRVALRVNPDIDPLTHQKISTGKEEDKFGISTAYLQDALDFCKESSSIIFAGLHFHIGSQIMSAGPYIELCKRVNAIWRTFSIDSYGGWILNLGGGLGVNYEDPDNNSVPDFESYFSIFSEYLDIPGDVSIHFELGRSLVAQCCRLITRVLYVKKGLSKKMMIVDAGMTELLRPALYQAVHGIENLCSSRPSKVYDVVGPACESSDIFARDIELPEAARGDIIAIKSCGAYVQSMSLNYNLRTKAESVYFYPQSESNVPALNGHPVKTGASLQEAF